MAVLFIKLASSEIILTKTGIEIAPADFKLASSGIILTKSDIDIAPAGFKLPPAWINLR